jgi:large subunit ribosomal protein L32e
MSDKSKDRLLRIRKEKNKKRPEFLRAEYHRLKRIQTSWRRPRGIDSKMRHKVKGKRKSPNPGYRNPKLVRGLHPSGFKVVQVFNIDDLEKINPELEIIQMGRTVGNRKRTLILERAEELKIHVINPQLRREEFLDEVEDVMDYDEDDFDLLEDSEDEDLDLAEVADDEDEVEEDFEIAKAEDKEDENK